MTQIPDTNDDTVSVAAPSHEAVTRRGSSQSFLPRTHGQRLVAATLSILLMLLSVQITQRFAWDSDGGVHGTRHDHRTGRLHAWPIIQENGRRLIWARGAWNRPDTEWFDVTDSTIDPEKFQYGIGKDTIPSIDAPQFLKADDPRLRDAGIDKNTLVIGFGHDGDARAYPLHILNRHELVNDTIGGKPVTVGW